MNSRSDAFILRNFLFILILGFSSSLLSEEKTIEGLLFNSIYDEPKGRNNATSLTIPPESVISFDKDLSIEFDVFFWRKISIIL